ncbi:MAG: hypothetical protein ACE364_08485 [Chlorobiota bacterium]
MQSGLNILENSGGSIPSLGYCGSMFALVYWAQLQMEKGKSYE